MTGLQGGGEDPVRKRRKRLCNNNNNNLLDQSTTSTTTTTDDKTFRFNDSVTADIDLSLYLYDDESTNIDDHDQNEVVHHLYLHSEVLLRGRSQYFSALLSDRWSSSTSSSLRYFNLTYKVPSSSMKSIDTHLIVIELLYSDDDDDVNFTETINTVSSALSILPVAIELLFEDCVKACIRLIEALPWTEEEEKRVLDLIPLLKEEESQELISRVKIDSSDDMFCRLIHQLRFHQRQKDFVGKMLREFPSKDPVKFALYHEFEMCFECLNDVVVWGYLAWLIGRMVELRVADTALDRWIDQGGGGGGCSLTGNLQKVCSTDKKISPLQLVNVFACTWKLADVRITRVATPVHWFR